MADENMYDESEPTTAESDELDTDSENDSENANEPDKKEAKSEETEDQMSLVPKHFFKDEPKPGNREMVEVVEVYDGEVSIRCVYGDKDDDKNEEESEEMENEPEDEMMT